MNLSFVFAYGQRLCHFISATPDDKIFISGINHLHIAGRRSEWATQRKKKQQPPSTNARRKETRVVCSHHIHLLLRILLLLIIVCFFLSLQNWAAFSYLQFLLWIQQNIAYYHRVESSWFCAHVFGAHTTNVFINALTRSPHNTFPSLAFAKNSKTSNFAVAMDGGWRFESDFFDAR